MAVKTGMGQMVVVGGARDANLARAEAMIARGAGAGCAMVVLPECLDLGWTHPAARELAEAIPGPSSTRICEAARAHGVYVAAGLTERAGDAIYNAAILADPAGDIVLKHRKINILDIARDLYTPGDGTEVAETPWGTVGMLICADLFPEMRALGEGLARRGARLIVSPCAWAVPAAHDNNLEPYGELWRGAYGALTRAYPLSIVGVSNVGSIAAGPWAGRQCIGSSLAMGPGGTVLDMGPYGVDAACLRVVSCPLAH